MRANESRNNYQPYFPNGELALDGAEVLKSSEIGFCGESFDELVNEKVYFEDIQAYMEIDKDQVKVLDVSNAFKPRQECRCMRLVWCGDGPVLLERLRDAGIKTMNDLYQYVIAPSSMKYDLHGNGYELYAPRYWAPRTYSPFVPFGPIKNPKEWTAKQVWRAIISGQIYRGTVHMEDMPRNEWEVSDMAGLAHNLINDCCGLMRPIKAIRHEDGTAVIELRRASRVYDSCPHPEYDALHNKENLGTKVYTLYFDPACGREEASRRWFSRLTDVNRNTQMLQCNPWDGWRQR